jgi:N-acetylglucosaminyldiphosphoundecaprenol N-acetyl-beta-D-mannosaminyltransferase
MKRTTVNILGVSTDVTTYEDAVRHVESFIEDGGPHYICVNSTQDIIIAHDDESFRQFVNHADLAIPDGWPVVWSIRRKGAVQRDRVTGPDLMLAVCARSATTGHSHMFFGGAEGVPERLAENLKKKFPGLKVAGTDSPPFPPWPPGEDQRAITKLNNSGADVLWVGLGTPKQQHWIRDHLDKVNIPVMIGVGAAFDYYSGQVQRAPVWMQDNGMEWIYRLYKEPRRLWLRYLNYLPRFALHSLLDRLALRKYPLD